MSHPLIDLNEDLRRLRDKGFNLSIHEACLVVRDIPYVTASREVRTDGILVSPLDLDGDITRQPSDHQIRFAGERPSTPDGSELHGVRPHPSAHRISAELSADFHFSNKPKRGHYLDFYEKIDSYAKHLWGPAQAIDPKCTPYTYVTVPSEDDAAPFRYLDTASGRAEISAISQKLTLEKVAIIGVGGTGSYVLDLLAKTPIGEIHLFDDDVFSTHNAFRSPGAPTLEELRARSSKVEYFAGIYSKMRDGIIPHDESLTEDNLALLDGMAFVFLCIDANPDKRAIVDGLEERGIPFIETGLGVVENNEKLTGLIRTTTSLPKHRDKVRHRIPLVESDVENEYDRNIQIADLNMLNAVLAVIRWKKWCGFYVDMKGELFSTYAVARNALINEHFIDES